MNVGKSFLYALIITLCLACEENQAPTTFTRLPAEKTGVDFANETGENDSFNILTNEYIYNGGGVGVGDFNQDGQIDLFFSGCDAENKLYLNEGDFKFNDVTSAAGVGGGNRWNNGVTILDVNDDQLPDIYVCATTRERGEDRANQLFLNQGNNAAGIPTFTDVAPAYGIADTSHNTQAAWLDYDGDGDMDLFLLVNRMVDDKRPNDFSRKVQDGSGERTDKLFRQDQVNGKITFTEVGPETGILYQGFSLAATVCDINQDGWPDLYVSNDYLSNDLMYINTERDGKQYFEELSYQSTKHTSYSAMGNDVTDLNNDGLPDIIAVDMLPADNLRRKMMMTANNYTYLINLQRFGYHPQFTRNTIQLSQGKRVDSLADLPNYGEVAMQSGIPATDWSWTPLVADFDLDGRKDVIITNGFPRDITDKDFGDYNALNSRYFAVKDLLKKIPSVKIPNVAYRASNIQDGIPYYEDVSEQWGIDVTSFSNGAAAADLDGDGDLDYVVNNIYDAAHVYQNNTIQAASGPASLKVTVAPDLKMAERVGVEVALIQQGVRQSIYIHPHRGYLSSSESAAYFSLDSLATSPVLEVRWPQGEVRRYTVTPGAREIQLSPDQGTLFNIPDPAPAAVLKTLKPPDFLHIEEDYVDFNVQPMLLHKLSQQGPGLAVSDINKDGFDDLYISGSYGQPGTFMLGDGVTFRPVPSLIEQPLTQPEELGVLFFDADGDGDEDLYVVSGSYEFSLESGDYVDRFYRNDAGRFTQVQGTGIEDSTGSGSCVRASDYDGDGDLDLFVGSRVEPHAYPKPVASKIFRNESRNGQIKFTLDQAATDAIASATNVTDALFTDFDNDGDADLLVTGEWSPIRCYKNDKGSFTENTTEAGTAERYGWWTSITPGDFDNDGDVDYVVGNIGQNSIFQPSEDHPVTAIIADVDENGGLDFLPFTYLKDENNQLRSYPYFGRSDFAKQVNKIKALHINHRSFADTDASAYMNGIAKENRLHVNESNSVLLENTDAGFLYRTVPARVQSSPLYGAQSIDLNNDGLLDLVTIGNDYGTETGQGYMDAGNGLVLMNQGDLSFASLSPSDSGFSVPGEGRSLALAKSKDGWLIVATQNSGKLVISAPVLIGEKGPAERKTEIYWGAGYLSQNGGR